ncbi:MAG: class I SAM-dependent methyltransferase [Planctomycetota bacterium]|nr:MAG: class I SAM-dependent methyltransferase [Planctomycetota bacterium]
MGVADYILYRMARNWPSPMAKMTKKLQAEPGTDAYHMAYAAQQFDYRVSNGISRSVRGLDVLEIGTGHGGIACFMAAVGAKSVVGIDLNTRDLRYAREFARQLSEHYAPFKLPVEYAEMTATKLSFRDATFDLVFADNVFEHFTEPEEVMREAYRVLRPGGGLLVPVFSSIYSKYGLHLKHGLKLPWANVFFSERTIIRAMYRMAEIEPRIYDWYPGLSGDPKRVRDLRLYGDLNDITYHEFQRMAARTSFRVESFAPYGTRFGKVLSRVPLLGKSILMDVFSTGASAYLVKPGERTTPRPAQPAAATKVDALSGGGVHR